MARMLTLVAFRLYAMAEGTLEIYKGRLDLSPGVVVKELRLAEWSVCWLKMLFAR